VNTYDPTGGYPMRGWRYWLGWMSPADPVWLWHALFDGTRLCRCRHSAQYRRRLS
jgi:hypothetical protein